MTNARCRPARPAECRSLHSGTRHAPGRAAARLRRGLFAALLGCATELHAEQDIAPPALVPVCIACHGPNGVSASPEIPSLAGQNELYLFETLVELKTLATPSVIMKGITHDISLGDLKALAAHFSRQAYVRNPQPVDPARVVRGRKVVDGLCRTCHEDYGRSTIYTNYPLLAGQSLTYMLREVGHILARRRGVDDIKLGLIEMLPPGQIEDAVHFFASQHESADAAATGAGIASRRHKGGPGGK